MKYKKIAFLFPGQGAQYPGMGKDFFDHFAISRETFEEANDILRRDLKTIVFEGPESSLTETRNSQSGIYVTSLALMRALEKSLPELKPAVCAGLSLGEYSALAASKKLGFGEALQLVEKRGQFMNDACEATKGAMAVVMGMESAAVEALVQEIAMPHDLWAANFNCPGQVVISGTPKGIEMAMVKAKEKGAKRVLPLQVHGAFHSGLMKSAEERLKPEIMALPFKESSIRIVMNYSGAFVDNVDEMKSQLIKQVTNPVRWEQGVRTMGGDGIDLFVEIGCGKTLAGMNKRIGVAAPTFSIEKIEDIELLSKEIG